jgi:hypothetical protein
LRTPRAGSTRSRPRGCTRFQGRQAARPAPGSYLQSQEQPAGKQDELVEIQTEYTRRQTEVQLSILKLRRSIDPLKLGLQPLFSLTATTVGIGVLVMLYYAFTSREVVVNAFKAPSALAGRGLTGDVVAAGKRPWPSTTRR